jgi:hypothetical protein
MEKKERDFITGNYEKNMKFIDKVETKTKNILKRIGDLGREIE